MNSYVGRYLILFNNMGTYPVPDTYSLFLNHKISLKTKSGGVRVFIMVNKIYCPPP